jgi:glycosyltransferase involved in cell wall biosynthesis
MNRSKGPVRVLHVLDELKHSGAEVMLQLAYNNFAKSGIESHILSTGNTVGAYSAILGNTGYKIHHIPFRKSIGFFKDIHRLFRNKGFSVVHVHTERGFIWYIVLAKVAGVPILVRTFHNVFLFCSYLRWKRSWQRRLSQNVFRAVHTAISESVLVEEKERFANNCILVRNWTDIETFHPPSKEERHRARELYGLQTNDFVLVSIGSCSTVKNHLATFTAVESLNNLLDGRKVILLHVGKGPMLEEEQMYVRQHGLGEYIRFLGLLDDVRPCLYAADAFVMTSLWEGLGIAALEAMSAALPVVLYNVPGLRDLVRDGKGGLLIEPNPDCLAEALLLMIGHPELRKKQAQEAREVVLCTYSLEDSVEKFVAIYKTGACKDRGGDSRSENLVSCVRG